MNTLTANLMCAGKTLRNVLLVVASSAGIVGATNVWDLKQDWSETSNPNGPWSLKEGNTPLPHVAAWQSSLGGWTSAQPGWAKSENGNDRIPFWFRSTGTENFTPDSLAGDIVVHSQDDFSGPGNGPANVTWTSPISGVISISGGVWMTREISRSNDWKIYKNGTLLSGGTIAAGDAYNRATPFNFSAGSGGATAVQTISVTLGDVIKLEISRTSPAGDFAGVNFKISAGSVWNSGAGATGHTYIPVKVPGGITWQAAENAAIAAGGHLASIEYEEENAFVYSLVSGDSMFWFTNPSGQAIGPWLGGYQAPSGTEPAGGWQWVDGYALDYTNWAATEPDDGGGGTENRTIFYHPTAATGSFWDDYPAEPAALDLPRGYIIEIGPSQGGSTLWSTGPGANGHSYQAVYAPTGITWAEAEAAAQGRGGHLVSITSANENAFVFALVSGRPEFWFDNATNDGIGPWIGGFQPDGSPEPGGGWQWVDGNAFSFTNWEAGEPNNFSSAENRAHLFNGNGGIGDKWNDLPNSNTTRGYIIEFATTPDVPTGPEYADMLYAASQGANTVYQYRVGPTGTPTLVRSLTDGMDKPSGLAATTDHKLFVVQRSGIGSGSGKLSRFLGADDAPAFDGFFISSPVMDAPTGMAFRGDVMLVVDTQHNELRRFHLDALGTYVEQLPAISSGITNMNSRFVAVRPVNQEIFVSMCCGDNRLLRYLISPGGVVTANGEVPGGLNGLNNPHGITFSPWGEMFVGNYGGDTISRFVFAPNGDAIPNGIITGNELAGPIAVAFSPWGELFVGNYNGVRISRFTFSESGATVPNGSFDVPSSSMAALQFVSASAPELPPPCNPGVTTSVTEGLIGWWKGDGDAKDVTGHNDGTEVNGVTYETGRFGQAFRVGRNLTDNTSPVVRIGHLPELRDANAYTVSFWLKVDGTVPSSGLYVVGLPVPIIPPPPPPPPPIIPPGATSTSGSTTTATGRYLGGQLAGSSSVRPFHSTSGVDLSYQDVMPAPYPPLNQWTHIVGVTRSSDGFHGLYVNGVLKASGHARAGAKFPSGTGPSAQGMIGGVPFATGGTNVILFSEPCLMDDVRIYTRDLTDPEIMLISMGDDFNTCPPANTGIPPLAAARVPAGVRVSWPARFTGWSLESSTTLTAWTPVTGTPVVDASDFALTTSAAPVRQFFRLRRN